MISIFKITKHAGKKPYPDFYNSVCKIRKKILATNKIYFTKFTLTISIQTINKLTL